MKIVFNETEISFINSVLDINVPEKGTTKISGDGGLYIRRTSNDGELTIDIKTRVLIAIFSAITPLLSMIKGLFEMIEKTNDELCKIKKQSLTFYKVTEDGKRVVESHL